MTEKRLISIGSVGGSFKGGYKLRISLCACKVCQCFTTCLDFVFWKRALSCLSYEYDFGDSLSGSCWIDGIAFFFFFLLTFVNLSDWLVDFALLAVSGICILPFPADFLSLSVLHLRWVVPSCSHASIDHWPIIRPFDIILYLSSSSSAADADHLQAQLTGRFARTHTHLVNCQLSPNVTTAAMQMRRCSVAHSKVCAVDCLLYRGDLWARVLIAVTRGCSPPAIAGNDRTQRQFDVAVLIYYSLLMWPQLPSSVWWWWWWWWWRSNVHNSVLTNGIVIHLAPFQSWPSRPT